MRVQAARRQARAIQMPRPRGERLLRRTVVYGQVHADLRNAHRPHDAAAGVEQRLVFGVLARRGITLLRHARPTGPLRERVDGLTQNRLSARRKALVVRPRIPQLVLRLRVGPSEHTLVHHSRLGGELLRRPPLEHEGRGAHHHGDDGKHYGEHAQCDHAPAQRPAQLHHIGDVGRLFERERLPLPGSGPLAAIPTLPTHRHPHIQSGSNAESASLEVAFAEDGGPHAHDRRPLGDRILEIAAHAHRQFHTTRGAGHAE